MGKSNTILTPIYKSLSPNKGKTALLGFTDNSLFEGDLYDLQLKNWDINSKWGLPKKYDNIISIRCPYFSKNPEDFILRCYNNLNEEGTILLDWGLGDHWRFEKYKIGWIKEGEQEYCYGKENFLWSTVWSDDFLNDYEYKKFSNYVFKFGYSDIKKAIFKEVPCVLNLDFIKNYFDISYKLLTLWEDSPQLYIFIQGKKR
tara:strand:+ start:5549 stop:6151 length:603 start_codon:yes stop_codon:yes gene_type:complete